MTKDDLKKILLPQWSRTYRVSTSLFECVAPTLKTFEAFSKSLDYMDVVIPVMYSLFSLSGEL